MLLGNYGQQLCLGIKWLMSYLMATMEGKLKARALNIECSLSINSILFGGQALVRWQVRSPKALGHKFDSKNQPPKNFGGKATYQSPLLNSVKVGVLFTRYDILALCYLSIITNLYRLKI